MMNRFSAAYLLLPCFAALAVSLCVQSRALADLDSRVMFSVEWLVDESDTIVVVRDLPHPHEGPPEVLRTIKRGSTSVVWPLIPMETAWPSYKNCVPPSDGPVRLLFIRGHSELLQSVSLGRDRASTAIDWSRLKTVYTPSPINGIYRTLYGVTQFGDMLLTESSLHEAIKTRMMATWIPLKPRGNDRILYACPYDFPLNHSEECYSIAVPCDTFRRDVYMARLQDGDVVEKLDAVHQLAQIDDPEAVAAIEKARNCTEARQVFADSPYPDRPRTVQDIREAATLAVEKIRSGTSY